MPRPAKTRALLRLAPLVLLVACEPLCTSWPQRQELPVLVKAGAVAPPAPEPLVLKVMTWNVKYGAGRIDFWFDLWGDRTEMTEGEVAGNLQGLYTLINEVDPDILVTNEIEVGSKRSAYFDMVRGILDNTRLGWAAYTPVWQSRFVPTEGVGRMDMGNCVFSRFPIVRSERISQADRTDQDPLTRSFYLHRAVGRAEVDVGGRRLAVFAVHTEAYDQDGTNARQQEQILELMRGESLPFVMAGDLNAIPPGTLRTSRFNDEAPESLGTDFEQPPYDPDDLLPFFREFVDAIGLAHYGTTEVEQRRFYTHSVIGRERTGSNGEPGFWSRRLDYLFVRPPDRWEGADVLQLPGRGVGLTASGRGIGSDPMLLSDHCPVVGLWEVLR